MLEKTCRAWHGLLASEHNVGVANVITSVASWVDLWMDMVIFKGTAILRVNFKCRWFSNRSNTLVCWIVGRYKGLARGAGDS